MDKIELAKKIFFELEARRERHSEVALRNFEIRSRLAQAII